jgi:hypothetical protein
MPAVNAWDELFVPGSRHTHEERRRLELTRDEEGSHGRGQGPIDLDSGHVVIRVPGAAPPADGRADGKDE